MLGTHNSPSHVNEDHVHQTQYWKNVNCLTIAESLFLALARVLKEDWKKSIELTNIVYIFFCFSTFSVFHKLLAQQKVRTRYEMYHVSMCVLHRLPLLV